METSPSNVKVIIKFQKAATPWSQSRLTPEILARQRINFYSHNRQLEAMVQHELSESEACDAEGSTTCLNFKTKFFNFKCAARPNKFAPFALKNCPARDFFGTFANFSWYFTSL